MTAPRLTEEQLREILTLVSKARDVVLRAGGDRIHTPSDEPVHWLDQQLYEVEASCQIQLDNLAAEDES